MSSGSLTFYELLMPSVTEYLIPFLNQNGFCRLHLAVLFVLILSVARFRVIFDLEMELSKLLKVVKDGNKKMRNGYALDFYTLH